MVDRYTSLVTGLDPTVTAVDHICVPPESHDHEFSCGRHQPSTPGHSSGRDMLSSEFWGCNLVLDLVSSLLASMLSVTFTCGTGLATLTGLMPQLAGRQPQVQD